jgi:MFS transporter, DHA1 family, multidrug resistance protein
MCTSLQAIGSTLLLSALAALPSFGIDMNLSALDATAQSLGVSPDRAGLTITLFMLGYAVAPPICGPISDQVGRKPVVLGALAVFALASLGCATSQSLSGLLTWRLAEGMGAGVTTSLVMAINNDLFGAREAEVRLSRIASVMLVVPMLAPAAGSAVVSLGGWRGIFFLLAALGLLLACCVWCGFVESLQHGRHTTGAAALLHGYACAIRHPACLGYSLVNAAGFGMMFAWLSGSPLLLIGGLGLSHAEYSLAYAASFAGVIAGVQLNLRLGARGVASGARLQAGIALAIAAAAAFLVAILAGWRWAPGLVALLMLDMACFGLIAPNAIAAAIRLLPDHAGAASAVYGFIQVLSQSAVSAVVPALEMARDLDRLQARCPQLIIAKTLGAGHFSPLEVPDQINAMITRFLAMGLARPRLTGLAGQAVG